MSQSDTDSQRFLEALKLYYIDRLSAERVLAQTNVTKLQLEQSVAELVESNLSRVRHKNRVFTLAGGIRPALANFLFVVIVLISTSLTWHFLGTAPILNRLPGFEFEDNNGINYNRVSAFGDSFNYVNALFSALAFAGVIMTIVLQTRELRLQREALEETRNELRGQKLALQVSSRISAVSGIIQGYSAAYSANPTLHDDEYEKWRAKLETAQNEQQREDFTEHIAQSIRGQLDRWISELREIQESRI